MKTLKNIIIILILHSSLLFSCGLGSLESYFAKENYYNFLDASLVGLDEANPLYSLTSYSQVRTYAIRVEYYNKMKREANVKEWHDYLKGKLTIKELDDLLYENKVSLMKKVEEASFKRYWNFMGEMDLKVIEKEKEPFIKLRYLFLNMREAHYAGKYQKTLDIYAKVGTSLLGVKSIVHEWIDALRAGAMQHLGHDVHSNLLYAKVLEYKTNAYLGYYDFKIENDGQWTALLAKATTADEKAKLYFLRALKWEGSPLLEHEAIGNIAPKSIWFERLTYMIMQDFQEKAYRYEVRANKNDKYVKEARKVYLLKEKRFLATLDALSHPSFFSLYSKTYLNFLKEGKLDRTNMSKLGKIAKHKEKKFIKILNYLEKTIQVNKQSQKALYASLEKLSKEVSPELGESLFNYTAFHNSEVYSDMSAKRVYAKIFADNSYLSQYYISRDAISADSFEAYVEEKNRNFFEKKLFKKSMRILGKDDVARTLAFLYIKDGNFKKAQKYLDQVPTLNQPTEFNPFNVSLSGNNRKVKGKGYRQRKFVKIMLKLEESIKKNPTSAMDHFLYATGRYNSSWFGNFRGSASVSWSTRGFSEEEAKHILHNYIAIEKEYELALKYAKKEEFKAKIAYQILKIKLNREVLIPSHASWIVSFGEESWGDYKSLRQQVTASTVLNDVYGKYVQSYKDTKYGKEIIRACATFKYFK